MKPNTTFIEQLRELGGLDDLRHPAKLLLDGQVLSTGRVHLQESVFSLMFLPDNGKTLDTPIHGATLMLRISLSKFRECLWRTVRRQGIIT